LWAGGCRCRRHRYHIAAGGTGRYCGASSAVIDARAPTREAVDRGTCPVSDRQAPDGIAAQRGAWDDASGRAPDALAPEAGVGEPCLSTARL